MEKEAHVRPVSSPESGNGAGDEHLEGLEARFKKEARRRQVDFASLKSGGFIKQRQKERFTVRLKVPGGRLPVERMKRIVEVAEKYGGEFVHLSVRQSVEIPYVHIEDFDVVVEELGEVGQEIASCGPRVRVPTACGGCEYNPNGLTDTQALALETCERYFGTETHHKFKITFSGCPIDCVHARQADLGFLGQVHPELVPELCTACGLCVKACDDDALRMENELPVRDESKCIKCGDCMKTCPFEAFVGEEVGHAIHVGGKGGKHPRKADLVAELYPNDKVNDLIESVLGWYKENGVKGERLGTTIDRMGLDRFRQEVIGE